MYTRNVDAAAKVGLVLFVTTISIARASMDSCYLSSGVAQKCLPPFVNAAFGRTVIADNTCGTPAEEYCLQTGVTGVTKSCHTCDNSIPELRHDEQFLTDLNSEDDSTWWQSNTMLQDVQYPTMINLTLNLSKTFDITYVRLKFHTSRPESFAIYKKKCHSCDWQPYQFYSGSCFTTYDLDNKEIVTTDNEQKALCTDDFSDISPLTGGNVAFSTLEGRPSAYNFDKSPVLQDWVKAVAIRITLNRINTFGDEVFKDPKVLKSYFYAISDLSVGGRCSCHGHAAECYVNAQDSIVCRCQHNTAGPDCRQCRDGFNDMQWRRATRDDPAECQECDCNGMSNSCFFDSDLFRTTGRGGHCTECRDNTDGPHCERCLPYHYRDQLTNRCRPCQCNDIGSRSQQCDESGQCTCKPGVGGQMCDQCLPGFYRLSEAGCILCRCNGTGSENGTVCDAETGQCVCKLNVEGPRCDRCKLGSMHLQASNPYGCTSCFCYGHSNVCDVSDKYTVAYIVSQFSLDKEGWRGVDYYGSEENLGYNGEDVSMQPDEYNRYMSYFVAPEKFLGRQQFSYNQHLQFNLRVATDRAGSLRSGLSSAEGSGGPGTYRVRSATDGVMTSREDLVIEGDGKRVVASITDQENPYPSSESQLFKFRLHEASGFYPRLSAFDFQRMLNNITSIRIRSTYGRGLTGHLDDVSMTTAELGGVGPLADWVEECAQSEYNGDSLSSCAPGFTRDPPNGNVYDPCVRCNCNGHSDVCDPLTGVCDCQHNTMGAQCEMCDEGYYFNGDEARRGTPQECQPCPCPQNSGCVLLDTAEVVCTKCPPGYAGKQCEFCMDGWFGEPRGRGPCQRCMCSGNIDSNAVMNCNRTTGECLKCIHNTTGFYCDQCLSGYFGTPVTNDPAERCKLCECDHMGSKHMGDCNPATGQCDCYPNVEGRNCDRCRSGFWNLFSGIGCEACNCHPIGSSTGECDENSGKCVCLPGVGGQKCDQCLPNHFGMTRAGCRACECNVDGSETLQCGANGKCVCKEGVLGLKCDQCQENYHDIVAGCIECPPCYGLVQDAVDTHRRELDKLESMADNIGAETSPTGQAGNEQFERELQQLNDTVKQLYDRALENDEKQEELNGKIEQVENNLQTLFEQLVGVESVVEDCANKVEQADESNEESKNLTQDIRSSLNLAQQKLDQAAEDLQAAQAIAEDTLSKQDNMSRLADEAEQLANRHVFESDEATNNAQTALDTSREAQDSIQEAIDVLETLMTILDELNDSESKLPATQKLRDYLLSQSETVKNNAEAAKNESTDLFTDAEKLVVPDVDTDAMETRASRIEADTEKLMPEIEDLRSQYTENYVALEADFQRATELLRVTDATQDTVDMLLARAHRAHSNAQLAVEEGTARYQDLLDLQSTLQSFDDEISQNRDDALAALANAGAIEERIATANNKTQGAKDALGQSRAIAAQASDKALQSLNIAQGIQSSAQNILQEAETSQTQADQINDDVLQLSTRVEDTDRMLSEVESRAEQDKAEVATATTAASDARQKAATSKMRVDSVLGQLEVLLDQLNAMREVSEEDIARLEAELERLRGEVEAADIAGSVTDLEAANVNQQRTLALYDTQLDELRRDVDNLQDIKDALPTECSVNEPVEQP